MKEVSENKIYHATRGIIRTLEDHGGCQEPMKWSLHLPYKPSESTLSRVDLLIEQFPDGAIEGVIFPDCVIRVRFYCLNISKFFRVYC